MLKESDILRRLNAIRPKPPEDKPNDPHHLQIFSIWQTNVQAFKDYEGKADLIDHCVQFAENTCTGLGITGKELKGHVNIIALNTLVGIIDSGVLNG